MAKMFGQLGKTTVHIGIGNGQYIVVNMLPLSDFDTFRDLQFEFAAAKDNPKLTDGDRVKMIVEGRVKMIELAKKVMPVELHEKLRLMDYPTLSALVLVLCKGGDDAEGDDPAKKVTLPSQLAQAGQQ